MQIHHLLGLMVEAFVIVFAAKLARDWVLKSRGYAVNQLVVKERSTGAAISQAGFMVGILLGFLGAISYASQAAGYWSLVAHIALFGMLAIALQIAADRISDRLIFHGLAGEGVKDDNVSHSVGKAAVSIATGLVLRGSLADPSAGVLACLIWFVVGQTLMILAVLFYCRLTPYDDLAEIKRNNLAAAFPITGILIGLGLVIEAAVVAKGDTGVLDAALRVGKFLGVSLVLVWVFRLAASRILLPKAKLSSEIVEGKSVAAGLQEGVSFFLVSLIVTFFLS
jgi:uncharacterized membrane protein YjfL (UPF0719 family)